MQVPPPRPALLTVIMVGGICSCVFLGVGVVMSLVSGAPTPVRLGSDGPGFPLVSRGGATLLVMALSVGMLGVGIARRQWWARRTLSIAPVGLTLVQAAGTGQLSGADLLEAVFISALSATYCYRWPPAVAFFADAEGGARRPSTSAAA